MRKGEEGIGSAASRQGWYSLTEIAVKTHRMEHRHAVLCMLLQHTHNILESVLKDEDRRRCFLLPVLPLIP